MSNSITDLIDKSGTFNTDESTSEFIEYAKKYIGMRVIVRFGWPGLLASADPSDVTDFYRCFIALDSESDIIPHEKYSNKELLDKAWITIDFLD